MHTELGLGYVITYIIVRPKFGHKYMILETKKLKELTNILFGKFN